MDFCVAKRKSVPKKKFTPEEDELLKKFVAQYGEHNWERIAALLGNRNARQCHDRWKFYINPKINKEPFTQEEDYLLINLVYQYGSMWVQISKHFKNRSDVQMKNRWKTLQKQMNLQMPNYNFITNSYKNQIPINRVQQQTPVFNPKSDVPLVSHDSKIQDNPIDSYIDNIFQASFIESPNVFDSFY